MIICRPLLPKYLSQISIISQCKIITKRTQTRFSLLISRSMMRAVRQDAFGGPETLYIGEATIPEPTSNQILVEVYGTAVNRADTYLCKGSYPGQRRDSLPDILGLEMAGKVHSVGSAVAKWSVGDRVMALMPQAGYAEYVAVNESHVMPVPDSLSFSQAGGIPEVWLTAYQLLHLVGSVKANDHVLIHGGGSGVGTAATQLVKLAGGFPIITAGTKDKINVCLSLGAKAGFNYKEGEFAPGVMEATEGKGVDLILDCVGASYWKQNLQSLACDGTWVNYGLLGGGNIDGNLLGQMLAKRGRLLTSTLKSRSDEYKAHLISEFTENALPYFSQPTNVNGKEIKMKPVIDKEFPLDSIMEAHKYLLTNKNIGKISIKVKD